MAQVPPLAWLVSWVVITYWAVAASDVACNNLEMFL